VITCGICEESFPLSARGRQRPHPADSGFFGSALFLQVGQLADEFRVADPTLKIQGHQLAGASPGRQSGVFGQQQHGDEGGILRDFDWNTTISAVSRSVATSRQGIFSDAKSWTGSMRRRKCPAAHSLTAPAAAA